MMGVAAVALDQGYRVVVVLAGDKDDLRQQTARRFNSQLLRQSDPIPNAGDATTLGTRRGPGPLGGFAPPYQLDANQFSLLQVRMESALDKGQPCLVVVKKNVASLRDLQGALQYLYGRFGVESLPTLVFDDECDEASVDSVETTIPMAIANLWRRPGGETPRAAYLGYTATAAANLLQDSANELYPEHSVYLLRYPGEQETAIEYREPNPDAWYSGGDCFYRTFGDEPGEASNFLINVSIERAHLSLPIEQNPSLLDALRAYFVAGAYRLAADPSRTFADPVNWPQPHSMLVQTSAATDEHTRWAKGIEGVLGGRQLPDRSIAFDADLLETQVTHDESLWRCWYERFDASRERIYEERPHVVVQPPITWSQVKARLREVFESTRLKVVNSDPTMGVSLDFSSRRLTSGAILAPQDIYVIVVGGAKLSRGLTIEGLCVSYFVRWTPNPTEDTVLQMSRWFGYRGPYLEYCRVFTTIGIAESLRQMQENDVDLRFQLAELMAEMKSPAQAALVLRANPRALPTSKMGTGLLVDLAFSPYTNVFRNVEIGALGEANQKVTLDLTKRIRDRDGKVVTSATGVHRGVLSRGWAATEVADILDSFAFSVHNPPVDANPMREFYRATTPERPIVSHFSASDDPYQLAAYLRAWSADAAIGKGPPRFNVGFAFGEMRLERDPFDFALVNRQVSADGRVIGGWTGRSANWDGDAFFDSPSRDFRIVGSQQRQVGADGLFLLYVIHKNAAGRSGEGQKRLWHTPMLAVSVPAGGPVFRRVVADGRS
jgi:hypothetical protein